jgi:hypothetical protein
MVDGLSRFGPFVAEREAHCLPGTIRTDHDLIAGRIGAIYACYGPIVTGSMHERPIVGHRLFGGDRRWWRW